MVVKVKEPVGQELSMLREGQMACVGGVAKNAVLRGKLETLALRHGASLRLAPLAFCTDNAAMVAAAAGLRAVAGVGNPLAAEVDPSLPLVEDPA